ncbi:MAG TPA: cobyric acid synthase, partial [Acidimicrobiales bacterium]
MHGALMVCGTSSDAGKSTVVTGLCRLLARRGVRVAPFKGQNMSLNSMVTASGGEIGRAQWLQATAAGAEPEVAMNPVLLKPTGERSSQVVVMGRSTGVQEAGPYQSSKGGLTAVVDAALSGLRKRFDVIVLEGAGSPAEINLLEDDIVNLGLAARHDVPAVLVGDIERGGVFAHLFGTVAILPDELSARIRAFVINR